VDLGALKGQPYRPASAATTTVDAELAAPGASSLKVLLQMLRRTPTGAGVFDQFRQTGATISVMSDAAFRAQAGASTASATYDAKTNTIALPDSTLQKVWASVQDGSGAMVGELSTLAHEMFHAIDDANGVGTHLGSGAPQGSEAWTRTHVIEETRAYLVEGLVTREQWDKLVGASNGQLPDIQSLVAGATTPGDKLGVISSLNGINAQTYAEAFRLVSQQQAYNPSNLSLPVADSAVRSFGISGIATV
jgi:hypothetical protein